MDGDAFHADCQGRDILDHLTSRWAVLILSALHEGEHRFSELHRRIEGISEKMLSQTLRTLLRDGLLERTVAPATPPQVSYALTPLGAALTQPLLGLLNGIRENAGALFAAQHQHDRASR
ncbi:MAG: helix-turn-helix transcriptional regulator [Nonomuraea sp.]|nr:helix-turn-helix transcriptional regulator [Nonomuraea sp.]NUP79416.1 helix-turn-helix transcriptional regulator [Nonomuraea sp.]